MRARALLGDIAAQSLRPLMAHCHLGLGALYRRAGKRQETREHITTAVTMFGEMDTRYWRGQGRDGNRRRRRCRRRGSIADQARHGEGSRRYPAAGAATPSDSSAPSRSRLLQHDHVSAADRERRAELVAPTHDLLDRLLVLARVADIGFVVFVMAHHRERDLHER